MLTNTHLISFDVKGDERGSLIALEQGCNVPFPVARAYYIFDTAPESGGDITPTRTCCKSQFASRAPATFCWMTANIRKSLGSTRQPKVCLSDR